MFGCSNSFQGGRPGDRVWIRSPQGQEHSGRVVMAFPYHLVLNMGGPHGRPGVADARNFVKIKRKAAAPC